MVLAYNELRPKTGPKRYHGRVDTKPEKVKEQPNDKPLIAPTMVYTLDIQGPGLV